jgi:hypothetical protein
MCSGRVADPIPLVAPVVLLLLHLYLYSLELRKCWLCSYRLSVILFGQVFTDAQRMFLVKYLPLQGMLAFFASTSGFPDIKKHC